MNRVTRDGISEKYLRLILTRQYFEDLLRDNRIDSDDNLRAWLWFQCPARLRNQVEDEIRNRRETTIQGQEDRGFELDEFETTMDELANVIEDFPERDYLEQTGILLRRAGRMLREAAAHMGIDVVADDCLALADQIDRHMGKNQ